MKKFIVALCLVLVNSNVVPAKTLPSPAGEVILTLSGAIQNETVDGVVKLDIEQLRALPQITFTTKTIWLEGEITFTGISLKAILEHAGFVGDTVYAVALNDYKVEIPLSDIDENAPIVAYLLNGEEMSPRGKGPLWIVYPYDAHSKYRSEVHYSRSIWQLTGLRAEE